MDFYSPLQLQTNIRGFEKMDVCWRQKSHAHDPDAPERPARQQAELHQRDHPHRGWRAQGDRRYYRRRPRVLVLADQGRSGKLRPGDDHRGPDDRSGHVRERERPARTVRPDRLQPELGVRPGAVHEHTHHGMRSPRADHPPGQSAQRVGQQLLRPVQHLQRGSQQQGDVHQRCHGRGEAGHRGQDAPHAGPGEQGLQAVAGGNEAEEDVSQPLPLLRQRGLRTIHQHPQHSRTGDSTTRRFGGYHPYRWPELNGYQKWYILN